MSTTLLLDHVGAYAAAVRHHLADLPAEQVEDLTDGLEADLTEALADPSGPPVPGSGAAAAAEPESAGIDLTRRFGTAWEYAAELRAAAGLPASAPDPTPAAGLATPLSDAFAALRTRVLERTASLRATAGWKAVVAFLVTLRPVWWVGRGWVVYCVVAGLVDWREPHVPHSFGYWVLLAGLVVLSVQWGRGLGTRRVWARRLSRVRDVVVVLVGLGLVASLGSALDQRSGSMYVGEPVYIETGPGDGVWVDGQQVSNLFVYDAEGNVLSDVQVFDDRGRPVGTVQDMWGAWALPGVDGEWSFVPSLDEDGRERWNVFPLRGAPAEAWGYDDFTGEPVAPDDVRTPPRPFAKAPALAGAVGGGAVADGAAAGGTAADGTTPDGEAAGGAAVDDAASNEPAATPGVPGAGPDAGGAPDGVDDVG